MSGDKVVTIYFLDEDPATAARYIPDQMFPWAAQQGWHVLRRAIEKMNIDKRSQWEGQYSTKVKYLSPWAQWAYDLPGNTTWLRDYLDELYREYAHRFSRNHAYCELFQQELRLDPLRHINHHNTLTPDAIPAAPGHLFPYENQRVPWGSGVSRYRGYVMTKMPLSASWKRSKHGVPPWWHICQKPPVRSRRFEPGVERVRRNLPDPKNAQHPLKRDYVTVYNSPIPTYPEDA